MFPCDMGGVDWKGGKRMPIPPDQARKECVGPRCYKERRHLPWERRPNRKKKKRTSSKRAVFLFPGRAEKKKKFSERKRGTLELGSSEISLPFWEREAMNLEDTEKKRERAVLRNGGGGRFSCFPGGWPSPKRRRSHREGKKGPAAARLEERRCR